MVTLYAQDILSFRGGHTLACTAHIYPRLLGMKPGVLHLTHGPPFPHAVHSLEHTRHSRREHTGKPVPVALLRTGKNSKTKQAEHCVISPHPPRFAVADNTPQTGVGVMQHFSGPLRAVENILAHRNSHTLFPIFTIQGRSTYQAAAPFSHHTALNISYSRLISLRRKRGFGKRTRLCRCAKLASGGSYSETFHAAEHQKSFSKIIPTGILYPFHRFYALPKLTLLSVLYALQTTGTLL